MNQKADASQNSTVLQVAGSVNYGLSFADCERLFQLLLSENFPKLEAIAADKAKANVEELVKSTYEKLSSRIDSISIEKLAEPDVQSTFNVAVQGAARKGKKIDINLLAELLEARVEKGNTDYIDYSIEAAVDIVPKLTSEMLMLLPALHFIQSLTFNTPTQLDGIFKAIDDNFLSKCNDITSSKMKTIASVGAGSYINITGSNTFTELKKRYPILNEQNSELNFPHVVKALKFYDSNNLHQLTLTTPGQVIAIKMLGRIFPAISIKNCLVL